MYRPTCVCAAGLGRVDEHCLMPLHQSFFHGPLHDFFAARVPDRMVTTEVAEKYNGVAHVGFKFLDEQLEGKKFFCGDRCTLADIRLFCMYKFFNKCAADKGYTVAEECKNVNAWLANCKATEGFKAAFPDEA